MRAPQILETWDVPNGLTARALARNGAYVAESYQDGVVLVRVAATRKIAGRLHNASETLGLAVSDDGSLVALIQGRTSVRVRDVASGHEVWRTTRIPCGTETTRQEYQFDERYLAFSPDNRALLVTAETYSKKRTRPAASAFLCDLTGMSPRRALPLRCEGSSQPFNRALFSPDGRYLPLNVDDVHVQYWDRDRDRLLLPLVRRRERMMRLWDRDPDLRWDPVRKRFLRRLAVRPSGRPREIAMSANGAVIAWLRGPFIEYGPQRGPDFTELHDRWISAAVATALHPSGEVLAVSTGQGVAFVNLASRRVTNARVPPYLVSLAFDAGGRLFGRAVDHRIEVLSGPE